MTPFEFLNAINFSKEDIIGESEIIEKEYNAFIVNKGLSFSSDTIFYANEMNRNNHLDKKMQFDYLMNSVSRKKRYNKWFKKEKNDDLQIIKDYYKFSNDKAVQALEILTKTQIDDIKEKMSEGGTKK